MINSNLEGKRLLLVGGVGSAIDLITLAKRNGVFIGVADYNEGTHIKKAADAAYNIDATDSEKVAELFQRERFDGMITNFSDMLAPFVNEAAEKVGCYMPYNYDQLRLSTDKKYFKQVCIDHGVTVPKEYSITAEDDLDIAEIEYPVIVKPVDGSGSRGISICRNKEELKVGLGKAFKMSRHSQVIVEQCILDDEINVTYIAQDGNIQLAAIHDRYLNTEQEGSVKVPDLYIYPSRYVDMYLEKYNDTVINMLKDIGIKNGSLFMQACVKDNKVYFYEAGMRLNGCKTYQILEVENDYNTFEHLMCFALTGNMGKQQTFDPKFKRWYATWNVIGRPGAVVDRFEGLDEIRSYPWLIQAAIRYLEGDRVPKDSQGTLLQLTGRIHVLGETKEQLIERLDKLQSTYQVYDPDGEAVLLKPHDIDDIRKKLNYSL